MKTEEEIRQEEAAVLFGSEESQPEIKAEVVEPVKPEVKEEVKIPEVPSEVAELKRILDEKERRLRQSESHIGNLQKQVKEAMEAASKLKDMPTKEDLEKQILAASESQKKWETFKEDNPDLFDGIEAKISHSEGSLRKEISEIQKRLEGVGNFDYYYKNKEQSDVEKQVALVRDFYPDYYNINKSAEFNDWVAAQPPHVRVRRMSNYAADALFLLDSFHESKKQPPPSAKKERLNQAIETKKNIPPRSKSEADMTEDEYRQKLAAEMF